MSAPSILYFGVSKSEMRKSVSENMDEIKLLSRKGYNTLVYTLKSDTLVREELTKDNTPRCDYEKEEKVQTKQTCYTDIQCLAMKGGEID